MPPLPELSLATEWFWTSGADGVLRIQGCGDCGRLVHPPTPICPYCRSRSAKPTEVSGRATVIGFTVNEHRWLPDFDPPYVVANVALAEDPSVHLTTNIVGCEPADVRIGQEVAVRFEQREDVWLPLFEPTGADRSRRPGARPGAPHAAATGSAPNASSTAPCSAASAGPSSAGASWSIPSRWPSTPASRRWPTPASPSRTSTGSRPIPAASPAAA